MIVLWIILCAIGLFLSILLKIGLEKDWMHDNLSELFSFTFLFVILGMFSFSGWLFQPESNDNYKQGQVDAINGKYKYEQEIHYKQSDGFIIPVDTIYIKIKEK